MITLVKVRGFSAPMTHRRRRIRQIGAHFWMRRLPKRKPMQARMWARTLTTPAWTAVYCCRVRRGLAQ